MLLHDEQTDSSGDELLNFQPFPGTAVKTPQKVWDSDEEDMPGLMDVDTRDFIPPPGPGLPSAVCSLCTFVYLLHLSHCPQCYTPTDDPLLGSTPTKEVLNPEGVLAPSAKASGGGGGGTVSLRSDC